jgi:hypothetical protein
VCCGSGNFYWADCEHVAALPPIQTRDDPTTVSAFIFNVSATTYFQNEFGANCGYSPFHSGKNHFDTPVLFAQYANKLKRLLDKPALRLSLSKTPISYVNQYCKVLCANGKRYADEPDFMWGLALPPAGEDDTVLVFDELSQQSIDALISVPSVSELKKSSLGNDKDGWAAHNIHEIPAERVYRHRYLPATGTWTVDESIVKIQTVPFDHGAMRSTYRMKKISQTHLRKYQKLNWHKAPNYVAKAYKNESNTWNPEDRDKVFDDIKLQYEADRWATKYNSHNPRKKIHFIQCFAIEFFQRPGCPVLGCERFVDGRDEFGAGFVKHNSNAGFVDHHESRMTPQTFSAYSFYASQGTVMVVDIQGVNDLYTDPQVHSINNRFGSADLGYRGIAYFFASFVRSPLCDFFSLPRFKLSSRLSAISRAECLKLYQRFPQLSPPDYATQLYEEGSDAAEVARALQEAYDIALTEVTRFREQDTSAYEKPPGLRQTAQIFDSLFYFCELQ